MNGARGHGFFIGIGSNVAPEENLPRVLERLLERFGAFRMSRVLRTEPVDMPSEHPFLNVVLFLETREPAAALKAYFNGIEEALGRDRSDRLRKLRDRPADIDLLCELAGGAHAIPEGRVPREPFIAPLFGEVARGLGIAVDVPPVTDPGQRIRLGKRSLGEAATAVHRDLHTGEVVVVEDPA